MRRHAGFGIPHGGRRQAGDRAEVALLVDQHVPHVPFLGHADQRGIDDAFAVRMIVTAGVAGDFRALHAAGAGREVQVVHRDQNAPLRGLQPVAHVGQRPADDDAHGVRQVAVLQLLLDRQLDQLALWGHVAAPPLSAPPLGPVGEYRPVRRCRFRLSTRVNPCMVSFGKQRNFVQDFFSGTKLTHSVTRRRKKAGDFSCGNLIGRDKMV